MFVMDRNKLGVQVKHFSIVGVVSTVLITSVSGFGFGSNLGCGITDEYGCCTSSGFFWCGSSGRCSYSEDVCEDGLGFAMPCTFTDFLTGVSFDLSPLTLTTSTLDHVVVDSSSYQGHTTTYIFNVCANAPSSAAAAASGHPAASSSASSSASFTSGFTSGKYGGDASNACFRMGGSVNAASTLTVGGDTTENGGSNPLKAEAKAEEGEEAEEAAYSMGLYDSAVPAKGVYVRYTQGNSCHRKDSSPTDSWTTVDPHNGGTCNAATFTADGERHCTRSLQLNFLCHNTQREVPSEAMVAKITAGRSVDPYDTCAFEITLESVYGCPTQCPLVPTSEHPLGAVCADHGRCAYGSFRGAHCVCSEGWEGLDCAASTTSSSGAQEESGGDGSAGNNNEAGAGEDGEVVQRDPFESSSSSSAASSSSLDSSNRRLLSLWWVLPLAFLVLAAFISGRAFLKWRHNRNDPQRSYEHVPTFEDFELIGAEGQRGKAPAGGRVEGGNPLEDGDDIGSGIF